MKFNLYHQITVIDSLGREHMAIIDNSFDQSKDDVCEKIQWKLFNMRTSDKIHFTGKKYRIDDTVISLNDLEKFIKTEKKKNVFMEGLGNTLDSMERQGVLPGMDSNIVLTIPNDISITYLRMGEDDKSKKVVETIELEIADMT